MRIQLTISLLVSDRPETLGRCLASLKPLLRELDSELIIVYTGKDPDTRKLAEKYTSHIIPFTWCNDFSKARNVGLKAAKGEWFLYLDDDEWFEDTAEIVWFFKSGEYQKYQSAFYIQRNYLDWEGSSYSDAYVGRMCRRTPDTKFIYPIHENLMPYPEPAKRFGTYVHHFGYVGTEDKKEQGQKSDRNLSLLFERLKDEPPSAHLYAQLAQEYAGLRDYNTAIRYCREGLALARKEQGADSLETWLAVKLPLYLSYTGKLSLALEEGEHILDARRLAEVGELNLAAVVIDLCWRLKEFSKGLKYVRLFRERLEYLQKHPKKAMAQSGITETFSGAEAQTSAICVKGLFFAMEEKEAETAAEILSWLPWEDAEKVSAQYGDLDEWKRQYAKWEEKILDAYEKLQTDNAYVWLQKAYGAERRGREEETARWWEKCAKDCPEGFEAQIVEIAVRHGFSLGMLLGQMSLSKWDACAGMLSERTEIPKMASFYQKVLPELSEYPLFGERLNQYFLEKQLTRGMLEPSHFISLLTDYCDSVTADGETIYRDEILEDLNSYVLPEKYKFAVLMREAVRLMEAGELPDCVPLLTEALRICPALSVMVSHMTRCLEERMTELSQTVSEEFVMLGRQVKQMLAGLMEQGKWEEAYGVVGQLLALLPEDPEVLKLKQEIICRR